MKKIIFSFIMSLVFILSSSVASFSQKIKPKYKIKRKKVEHKKYRPTVYVNSSNKSKVVIRKPNKPIRILKKPKKIKKGYIWRRGHWKWSSFYKRYIWVQGKWIREKRGYFWTPGYWEACAGGYFWVEGFWKR